MYIDRDTYTQIHWNTHKTFTYTVFECMWVLWVYFSVLECIDSESIDFDTFDDHVETDPDNTDLKYITNIHSNTLTHTQIHAHTLKYTQIHSNTLIKLTYTHIHSHKLTYTHIHSHTLSYTHIHSHTLTYTHIHSNTLYGNVVCVSECIWVYVSVSVCLYLHSHTLKYTHIHP